jgi:hypothetical protein
MPLEMEDIELIDSNNNMILYIQPLRIYEGIIEGHIVEYRFDGDLQQLFDAAFERVDEENYMLLEQCESILNGMGLRARFGTTMRDEIPVHSIELLEIDTVTFRYGPNQEDRDIIDYNNVTDAEDIDDYEV